MAQLKDTIIDGALSVSDNIATDGAVVLNTPETALQGIHPTSGDARNLIGMSINGNNVVGYGNYEAAEGNTHIYGNDVKIYSAAAGNVSYKPYYCAGDSLSIRYFTAGYVTSSSTKVYIVVPLAKPIIGSPTITITGTLILRQASKYTHGSTATTRIAPTKWESTGDSDWNAVILCATLDTLTNALNNDTVGIDFNGTITFS